MDTKARSSSTIARADLEKAAGDKCLHLPRREVQRLIAEILDEIASALVSGEEVKLNGFGSFRLSHKRERMGRNPASGVPARISARRVMRFKPSAALVALINRELS